MVLNMGIKYFFLRQKNGEKFYPYAHADSTFDKNGNKISNRLDSIDYEIKLAQEHISNKNNPHYITKDQIGLSNLENLVISDQIPIFTPKENLTDLKSGEKMSDLFGKIAKSVSDLIEHLSNVSNPHKTSKEQIGLSNIDNTSDINKPVSKAQKAAIDKVRDDLKSYTDEGLSDFEITSGTEPENQSIGGYWIIDEN